MNERALLSVLADTFAFSHSLLQCRLDFRVRHEQLPNESRRVVLDHDHDGGLVQNHIDVFKLILGEVKTIAEAGCGNDLKPKRYQFPRQLTIHRRIVMVFR